jgi:GNAT superfamily N-acetyltransferase
MKISIATINDIEVLTRVEIESKSKSIPQLIEGFEVDHDARLHRWQTWFGGRSPQTSLPERIAFKALTGDQIVGYIAGHLTTRYNLDTEIQSFYVLKEYQRKGVGSALLMAFVNWLKKNNATTLCVGIARQNPYQAFYLKHGGKYLNEHWIWWDDLAAL